MPAIFTAKILHRDNYDLQHPMTGLTFMPRSISASWHGGYKEATIDVDGDEVALWQLFDALRCGVSIYSGDGAQVWLGMIWGIDISLGDRRYTLSLDDVFNRVRVEYIAISEDGGIESYTGEWVDDAFSQTIYGIREATRSMSDEANAELAGQRAETELELGKLPQPERSAGDGTYSAQLHCVGLIKEIDDTYHEDTPGGRTEYEPGGTVAHSLGWQTMDTSAGFSDNGEGNVGAYSSFDGLLPPGAVGQMFSVASSLANNGNYTIVDRPADETQTLSTVDDGAGFRWDGSNDSNYLVEPLTEGLGFLGVGQQFDIDITTDSTGYVDMAPYSPEWGFEGLLAIRETGSERVRCDWDGTRADAPLAFDQGGVDDHPNIADGYLQGTLTAAPYVTVSPKPAADELQQDATDFLVKTLGWRVDQLVNIPVGGGGLLWKVAIPLSIVGTPTDTVRVSVWTDSGGSFGTLIDQGWITAAEVGTEEAMRWVTMDGAGTNTISDSTSVHIVVERAVSGTSTPSTHDPDNYWLLGIVEGPETDSSDEDNLYEETARFWNGSSWADRTRDASMPFRIWTGIDLSTQIANIIEEHSTMIAGAEAADAAGILVNAYAEGDRRALDIVQSLLDVGYNGGAGMVLEILPDSRRAVIREAGSQTEKRIRISASNEIEVISGAPISPGLLFVGEWADDMGAPPATSSVASMSPVLIADMRYDIASNKISVEPPGQRDIFDIGLMNA